MIKIIAGLILGLVIGPAEVVRYSIAGPAKTSGGLTNRLYHGGLYSDRQDYGEALLDEGTGFDA